MLKRSLDLFGAVVYGVGLVLGAGIYVLIGSAVEMAGNAVWISFLLAAIISSFTGLSYAELSTMFPKAGAEYVYIKNAFKNKLLGFIVGWLILFSVVVAVATVAMGFSSYFYGLFGIPKTLSAIILVFLLSILNLVGIKKSSWFNILFTFVEIGGLFLVIILGLGEFGNVNYFEVPDISGVFAAAALVFFAYLGFENVVTVAEETKNPSKNIPRALIISIIISTIFYVLIALATVSLVNWQTLTTVEAPLAYAVSSVLGPNGFTLLSFVALFATANSVLISLVVGSRIAYGMANDNALPQFISKVHDKTKTPWISILIIMVFSIVFILLENIDLVANLTSFAVFLNFMLINVSVISLRYKKPNWNRPFKIPLNIGKLPVTPIFGILSSLLMLSQFNLNVVLVGSVVIASGAIFFFLNEKLTMKNSRKSKVKTSSQYK